MRACYSIRYMSDAPFKNTKIIERIVHGLIRRLKEDTERPVRVEAAMAIQALLNDQNTAHGSNKSYDLLFPTTRIFYIFNNQNFLI